MTPQEISDYKQSWMSRGGYGVAIHSDLEDAGKSWCKKNLKQHQCKFVGHTNIYQHTFYFENQLMSQQFAQEFYDWIIK